MNKMYVLTLAALMLALGCASEPGPVVAAQPEVTSSEPEAQAVTPPTKPPVQETPVVERESEADKPAEPEQTTPAPTRPGTPKTEALPAEPPKPEPKVAPPPKKPEKPIDTATALQALASDICQKLIESVSSKDKRRMAVYYFCVQPGGRNAVGEYVASMLPCYLAEVGKDRIAIFTRRFLSAALKEQGQQLSAMYDETKQVELGKLVGARYIVCGTLHEFQNRYEASAEVVDVETGETAVAAKGVLPKLEDLVAMAKKDVIDDVKKDAPTEKDAQAGPAAKVLERGDHFYDQGEDEEALKAYRTAYSITPDLPRVLFRLGYLHQMVKKDAKAAEGYYDRYIEIVSKQGDRDDNYHKAFNNRGVIRMEKGDKGAMEDFDKAIEIDPKFADAYSNRGKCRTELVKEDLDKAVADYRKAMELAPKNPVCAYNLALLLDELARFKEAVEAFTKVIALDPKHKLALYGQGRVYADGLKEPEKAEDDFSAAIKIDPNFADALYARGVTRIYDLKRPKEGCADLRRVLELDPKNENRETIEEMLKAFENK